MYGLKFGQILVLGWLKKENIFFSGYQTEIKIDVHLGIYGLNTLLNVSYFSFTCIDMEIDAFSYAKEIST